MVKAKAPALGIIEEDVHHCAVHVSYLTVICPKFHAAQQRHTSVPRILEGQIKVPATSSVVGRWRDEEDTVHPTSIVYLVQVNVTEWFAVHNLHPQIFPMTNFQTAGVNEVYRVFSMVICAKESMSHLSWCLSPLPWAAPQAICNVTCIFAGSRPIMSP